MIIKAIATLEITTELSSSSKKYPKSKTTRTITRREYFTNETQRKKILKSFKKSEFHNTYDISGMPYTHKIVVKTESCKVAKIEYCYMYKVEKYFFMYDKDDKWCRSGYFDDEESAFLESKKYLHATPVMKGVTFVEVKRVDEADYE